MNNLPTELICQVYYFLSPNSLTKASLVKNIHGFDKIDFDILLSEEFWVNAIIYNRIVLIKLFITDNKKEYGNYGINILELAVQLNHIKIVELFLETSVNKYIIKWETMAKAIKNDNIEMIKLLLKHGYDINTINFWQQTVFFYAIKDNNEEIIELLLDAGANIYNKPRYGGITTVSYFLKLSNIEFLEKYHKDINWAQYMWEMKNLSTQSFKLLLKNGVDINSRNWNNSTLLIEECRKIKVNKSNVEFLIDNGADLNLQDNDGFTALHYIAAKNYPDILKLLLQSGANPLIANIAHGDYPIVYAISEYNIDNIKIIIEHNPDTLDLARTDGSGSLFVALQECSSYETIKYLIDKGPSNYKDTMHIALSNGKKEIIDLLIERKVFY